MFTDVYNSLYYSTLILSALSSAVILKRVNKSFKWLAVLIILTLISECTAYFISFHFPNNNIVYHFFTPVEYSMYAIIYSCFFNNKKWNQILLVSVLVLVVLEICNVLFFQSLQVDDTNIMIIESIMLVFLSLMLFTHLRTVHITENILLEGMFWFNSIVLVYYSFDILVWELHNLKVYQLENSPPVIYKINLLFSTIMYLVYAFSIFLNFSYKRKHFIPA